MSAFSNFGELKIDFNNERTLYISLGILATLFISLLFGLEFNYSFYVATGDVAYLNCIVLIALIVGVPLLFGMWAAMRKLLLVHAIKESSLKLLKVCIRPGDEVPFEFCFQSSRRLTVLGVDLKVRMVYELEYLDRTGLQTSKSSLAFKFNTKLTEKYTTEPGVEYAFKGVFMVPDKGVPSGIVAEEFGGYVVSGLVNPFHLGYENTNSVAFPTERRAIVSIWSIEVSINIDNWPDYIAREVFEVEAPIFEVSNPKLQGPN